MGQAALFEMVKCMNVTFVVVIVLIPCSDILILFFSQRHVSAYLSVQERDPKAHKFLGQLYELDGDINKAVGCYKVCIIKTTDKS